MGTTIKSSFPILSEKENLIFYFVLSKKYLILSNNLLASLINGNNIFKTPYFAKFTASDDYK